MCADPAGQHDRELALGRADHADGVVDPLGHDRARPPAQRGSDRPLESGSRLHALHHQPRAALLECSRRSGQALASLHRRLQRLQASSGQLLGVGSGGGGGARGPVGFAGGLDVGLQRLRAALSLHQRQARRLEPAGQRRGLGVGFVQLLGGCGRLGVQCHMPLGQLRGPGGRSLQLAAYVGRLSLGVSVGAPRAQRAGKRRLGLRGRVLGRLHVTLADACRLGFELDGARIGCDRVIL